MLGGEKAAVDAGRVHSPQVKCNSFLCQVKSYLKLRVRIEPRPSEMRAPLPFYLKSLIISSTAISFAL
jgi:hypothetical protein